MNLPPPESHLQIESKTRLADGSYKVLGIYKEEAGRRCILCREETHDFQGRMNHEGTWLSRYSLHRNQAQCLETRARKLKARRGGKKPRPLKKLEQGAARAETRSGAEATKPALPATQSRAAKKSQPKAQQTAQPRDKKPESRKPTSRKPTSRKPAGGKSPAAKPKAAKNGQAQSKKPGGQKTKRRGSPQTGQTSRRSEKQ